MKRRLTEVQAKDILANHDALMADLATYTMRLERVGLLAWKAKAAGATTVELEDLLKELRA